MELTKLMQADYLDIIYDNRNKAYGGYELRKNYNRRAGKAMLLLLMGVGTLCSFSLIHTQPVPEVHGWHKTIDPVLVDISQTIIPPVKPPVTPPPAAAHMKTVTSTVPVIIDDHMVPDKPMTENKKMDDSQPGTTTSDGTVVTTGSASGNGTDKQKIVTDPVVAVTMPPVRWVSQMPDFAGDMGAYISKHLRYPDAARSAGIEGQVMIEFVVNEDGSVSNARVVRGIGGGCDEEALRMVNSMPKWKPGKQNGVAVKVIFALPIKFILD